MISRRSLRLILVVTPFLWAVAAASSASAAPKESKEPTGPFSWIDVEDGYGVRISLYDLSMDRGNVMTSADKYFWSSMTEMVWMFYRAMITVSIWFIDWVVGFTWLDAIASPLVATGDALQSVIQRVGIGPALLSILALVAVFWMIRGRWSTGIWEIAASCVIAALAAGLFADPVRMVAGPDGFLKDVHQAGLEISAELVDSDSKSDKAGDLAKRQTANLSDTFVSLPTQMVNFGRPLSSRCEKQYAEVVKGGPYGTDDDIRDKVDSCDDDAGDYADNPSSEMFMSAVVFTPAGAVIMLLALLLGGTVLAAGVNAILQGLKLIFNLVTALLPGSARGPLLLSIADCVVSLAIVLLATIFLGVYLSVIDALFRQQGEAGESPVKTFFIVDVIMVVGLLLFMRWRKNLKNSAARIAGWMSQRPGGRPAQISPSGPLMAPLVTPAKKIGQMGVAAHHRRALRQAAGSSGPTFTDNRRQLVVLGGMPQPGTQHVDGEFVQPPSKPKPTQHPALTDTPRRALTAGTATGGGGGGGEGGGGGAPSSKLKRAAKGAGQAAFVAATAGTGAIATGAKALRTAQQARTMSRSTTRRREALDRRLNPPPPSARRSTPTPMPPAAPSTSRPPSSPHMPSTKPETPSAPAAPQRPLSPGPIPQTRSQFHRVVRDGQVVLVPKTDHGGDRS